MSGGKGGGGGDTGSGLRSQSTIKVVDALCEGEIGGLVNGLKSVYYNKVAVENADGSANINLSSFAFNSGTQNQPYLPGFGEVQSEVGVGEAVKQATGAVTRTITTPSLDSLKVTIAVPRLIKYDDKGNSGGTAVNWKVYLKVNNGVFILKDDVTIDQKSSSGFEKQSIVRIPTGGYTTLQVRVERITADSNDDKLTNACTWKSYTEVTEEKFAYPNIAVTGTEISSENLNGSVPSRIYHVNAEKVRIPTNATVQSDGSLTYAGVWNGTFTTPQWCADPAWALYDLLNAERYGGNIPTTVLNKTKWDFYTASVWCNTLVNNGAGGVEPRFLISIKLLQQSEAYELILQLCNVFNGVFYLLGEGLALDVDRPSSPVAILTNENSKFNYSTTNLRSRVTVALVEFQDPDNFGEPDLEIVEDAEGIALYGYQVKRITAVGCNRRSQAHRFGRWYLYTNRQQTNTVTINTGLLGARLQPGEVIAIADKFKTPYQGGRIIRASASRLTLDNYVTFAPGILYDLIVVLPDGSIDRRVARTPAGSTDYLNPVTPYTTPPNSESIWLLIPQTKSLRLYRVIVSTPQSEQGQYELSAIEYSGTKYAEIEAGLVVESSGTSGIPTPPLPPRNLAVIIESALGATGTTYSLETSWDFPMDSAGQPDSYTSNYQLQYRNVDSTVWTTLTSTSRSISLPGLSLGSYIVQVAAINIFGSRSSYIVSPAILVGTSINASAQFQNFESAIFVAMQTVT
jgi:predicted phage tail protein